ncbi:hypothetical protein [Pedobacter mucosus]|uniref:hypothetical protein n=1 Tax=Pedobacter mucosus TaxID=2895286 RepID=UPI001EE3CB75|nr:hypothetical protein [Pedobacter mucosus]UKT64604.1 hypothetical protein LOK61_02220 [Pedobacter mucosus]
MFKFFLSVLIILIPSILKAQNSVITVGAEIGLPSGNFTSITNIGLGVSVKADLPIATKFGIILNGGYMNFFGKRNQLINVQDLSYLPLKGGLKYQLSESFYAAGLIGAAIPITNGQKTLFIWSPGIGNVFKLNDQVKFDLGIRYEAWVGQNSNNFLSNATNSKGFVGVRLGIGF